MKIIPGPDRRNKRPTRTGGTARHLSERADISEPVRKKLLADNAKRFYGI